MKKNENYSYIDSDRKAFSYRYLVITLIVMNNILIEHIRPLVPGSQATRVLCPVV